MILKDLKIKSEYFDYERTFKESEIYCNSWNEIYDTIKKLLVINVTWIFRGLNTSKYNLKSSLERSVKEIKNRPLYLYHELNEFIKNGNNYLNIETIPENNDLFGWLSIMQHYGSPTNLLDWTYSPYIATFFAVDGLECNNLIDNDMSCIWAFNIKHLIHLCHKYLLDNKLTKYKRVHPQYYGLPDVFNKIYTHSQKISESNKKGFILPILPQKNNLRLLSQQGVFTYLGNIKYDFFFNFLNTIKTLKGDYKAVIQKIVFPSNLYKEIQHSLFLMNITARTLFPGIEGFARSLKQYISYLDYDLFSKDPSVYFK